MHAERKLANPDLLLSTPRLALRPRDAAKALGLGERKLWEVTADRSSGIPHVRLGKVILYPVAELERWLADQVRKEVRP